MPRVIENLLYEAVVSGELAGSVTAVQCPDVVCNAVQFAAASSNTGSVYVGGPGVTAPDGTTDMTTGMELHTGDPYQYILLHQRERW